MSEEKDPVDVLSGMLKQMAPQLWKEKDFAAAAEIEKTMRSPGWQHILEMWVDMRSYLWSAARRMKNSDNVWRFMGVLEGHDKTLEIIHEFVSCARKEREQQEHRKLVSEKEKQLEDSELGELMNA